MKFKHDFVFFVVDIFNWQTILRFAPVYERTSIEYRLEYDGNVGETFIIVFNNIPINIEIEHRSDSGDTKGKVSYNEMKDNDWWIETENRSAVSNFLVKKVGDCDHCYRVNGLFALVCGVLWHFFPPWFITV